MGSPFRILSVVEAITFMDKMSLGYEHYADFFVKKDVTYLQIVLTDAVCIPVAHL